MNATPHTAHRDPSPQVNYASIWDMDTFRQIAERHRLWTTQGWSESSEAFVASVNDQMARTRSLFPGHTLQLRFLVWLPESETIVHARESDIDTYVPQEVAHGRAA